MIAPPAGLDFDAVLRDGSTVHVRPVTGADREPLRRFLEALSPEARLFRFFSPVNELGWAADRFVDVDYRLRHGLLALHGSPEQIVGHAFYAAVTPDRAEVALEIADDFQGRGLGTALLGYLAAAAAAAGIGVFEAEVMPENHRMLGVFRDSGYQLRTSALSGSLKVEFPTEQTEAARERFARREHLAAAAAIRHFFEPASIAVIGATSRPRSIGGEVFRNLLSSGFPGPVYPVSPHPVVQSVAAYPDIEAIPGPVDLAVIVVPAAGVVEAAAACARRGVRGIVVISSGFAESGSEGRQRQADLLRVCRESGMRLVGPNCMGILNTDPAHRFNATFAPTFPPQGRIGFMSQSGALGLAVIDRARARGLGLSTFASVGNKADVSGNDLLEYWEDDDHTGLVLLYLESFGNPRRFARIARRISRHKPILAVKSGRSPAGARATSSHTGALLADSEAAVDALFRQSGVIRSETLGELFDVAALLAAQPPPGGPRVGIVTNAGGLGILCADACSAAGLEVPELPAETRAQLAGFLPAEASVGNPVDMIASATAGDYERTLAALAASPAIDALIVIFIPPLVTRAEEVATAIRRVADTGAGGKPLLAVFTSAAGAPADLSEGALRIPTYTFPEEAARALSRAAAWGRWRDQPLAPPWQPADARRDEAHALVAAALGRLPEGGWLAPDETARLLACYGIRQVETVAVPDARAAAAAAEGMAGPVALKAFGAGLVHKTEAGAVVLGLEGRTAVRRAAREMLARLAAAGTPAEGLVVQRMAPAGVEMIVGAVQDPVFGPVVACGAGGTAVEVLKDVSFRLAPLAEADAARMISELASRPLLEGYRGRPPAAVAALREIVLRVGALADDCPALAELDLNPVIVSIQEALVADARVRVAPPPIHPPEGTKPRP
ncbi:MAG TPA: GNAT family N-acetyltransferase [Candidatus Dormibacteraeota bacterium]